MTMLLNYSVCIFVFALLAAYCLGSLSFAVIVSKFMGLEDPHTYGSGNPGATNVLRSGNKKAALLTLLLDAAKGWLAVYAVKALPFDSLSQEQHGWLVAGVALTVFLGHLFPVFYGFKGGKGVATAAGVLIAINAAVGSATIVTWLAVAACFRYSSLAALVSAIFAVFYSFVWCGFKPIVLAVLMMSTLLLWRHKNNIKNLLGGQERRIGEKNTSL
jgi:acyl phosphate:glycerol-3-phosphate acyltransferase